MKNGSATAVETLERVARYIAGQDEPILKWLCADQASRLRTYLERAGFEGDRPWGNVGFRKTVCYSSPCCNLAISPLNQAGNFQYWGSIEYREAKAKKEAEARELIETAFFAARLADAAKLEETISALKRNKDKFPDLTAYEAFLHSLEYDLSKLKEVPNASA